MVSGHFWMNVMQLFEIVCDYVIHVIHVEEARLELYFIISEPFRGDFLNVGYSLKRVATDVVSDLGLPRGEGKRGPTRT